MSEEALSAEIPASPDIDAQNFAQQTEESVILAKAEEAASSEETLPLSEGAPPEEEGKPKDGEEE